VDFNKWISLISFGCTNVDFVRGWWISWISLFRQTAFWTSSLCSVHCVQMRTAHKDYRALYNYYTIIFAVIMDRYKEKLDAIKYPGYSWPKQTHGILW